MGLVGTFLLALVKAIVLVWGTLTNWAYRIIHDSTEVVKAYSKVRWNGFFLNASYCLSKVRAKAAAPIQEGDTSVTYVPVPGPKTSVIRDFEGSKCQTMADVWDWSVKRYI